MQHHGKNVRELWYAIRALHKRNTRGQRGLAKMKWISFRQGAKMTLSENISKFNSLHTDLLLTGVTFDAEAQLLEFQAGLTFWRFILVYTRELHHSLEGNGRAFLAAEHAVQI